MKLVLFISYQVFLNYNFKLNNLVSNINIKSCIIILNDINILLNSIYTKKNVFIVFCYCFYYDTYLDIFYDKMLTIFGDILLKLY